MINRKDQSPSFICKLDRQTRNGHKSLVVWLTGLSGAGKSTLGATLERALFQLGIDSFLLDGDILRKGLNQNLGFTAEERSENVRRVGEVAKILVEAGMVVIVSAISPYQRDRLNVRKQFSKGEFLEVYVKCSLEVCEKRDPKGLYQKVRAGEIQDFTGIHQIYEEPIEPDLIVETDYLTLEKSLEKIKACVLPALHLSETE